MIRLVIYEHEWVRSTSRLRKIRRWTKNVKLGTRIDTTVPIFKELNIGNFQEIFKSNENLIIVQKYFDTGTLKNVLNRAHTNPRWLFHSFEFVETLIFVLPI